MKNLILIVFVLVYPIINSFKVVTYKPTVAINKKISYLDLPYMNYYNLSEWDKLRFNLAQSVIKVHGNLDLYDAYCKVLNCESDGWRNAKNPKSSASGLFQCMRSTFKEMKIRYKIPISFKQFSELPLKEQACYFDEYLNLYKSKHKYLNMAKDKNTKIVYAYLMVLNPSAVGKSWNSPVFRNGTLLYDANKGIPHKYHITVKDIYSFCMKKFNN